MHLTLAVLAEADTNCSIVIDCLCCACDISTGSLNCTGRGVTQAALLATNFSAIDGIELVKKIYLEHNHLTAIPAGVFNLTIPSLQEVHLSYNDIVSIGDGVFPCTLNVNDDFTRLFFNLSFNAIESLAKVKLNISYEIDFEFSLDLSFNPLGSLSVEDLSGITGKITVFNFSGCNISSVESNAFDNFFGLNELYLNQNALTALPIRMLAFQECLTNLDVSHNALTTLPPISSLLNPSSMSCLPLYIDVSHNAIETLPDFTFAEDSESTVWDILNLSFNRMRSYGANNTNQEEVQCQIQAESQSSVNVVWDPQTPEVQYDSVQPQGRSPFFLHAAQRILSLRAPGVEWPASFGSNGRTSACATQVDCSCCLCVNYTSVVALDCSSRGVTEAVLGATDFLTSFFSVLAFSLDNNPITALPDGIFSGVPNLIFLNLSSSTVASVSPRAFAELSSLKNLDFSYNKLTSLPNGTFAGLPSLNILDISYNQLTSLPNGTFAGLPSLENLDISFNKLTSLPNGTFAGLPSLINLYLNYNRLASYDGYNSGANVANSVLEESGSQNFDFTVAWNPQVGFPCRA